MRFYFGKRLFIPGENIWSFRQFLPMLFEITALHSQERKSGGLPAGSGFMKKAFSVQRLVIDGLLIALFYALSLFGIDFPGVRLTFASLPIVIGAMLFGPLDGFLIGLLGEFLSQILRYGITATTVLWLLPAAFRGLTVGIGKRAFPERLSPPLFRKHLLLYFGLCLLAAVITSAVNTAVYYLDSKLFGYYNYAIIFGAALARLLTNLLNSAITAGAAIPVLLALYEAHLAPIHSAPKEDT